MIRSLAQLARDLFFELSELGMFAIQLRFQLNNLLSFLIELFNKQVVLFLECYVVKVNFLDHSAHTMEPISEFLHFFQIFFLLYLSCLVLFI